MGEDREGLSEDNVAWPMECTGKIRKLLGEGTERRDKERMSPEELVMRNEVERGSR